MQRTDLFVAALVVVLFGISPAAAQTVYVAVGDSITAGTGDESTNAAKGYPTRLETLLRAAGQTVTVRNEGVPGQNTDEALMEINQILSRGGDVMLLMVGTNDISRDYSPTFSLFNLNALAGRAQARGFQTIQATVIPRIPRAIKDPKNEINQNLNQLIRDQAGFANRRLVDTFEVFGRETNLFARFYDQDTADNVGHPNAAGYDLMARAFFDVITNSDTVPPVLGATVPRQAERRVGGARNIEVDLWDFGSGIDANNTRLSVNGTEVTTTVQGGNRLLSLVYTPPQTLRGVIRIGLRSRDLAATPNVVNRDVLKFYTDGTVFPDGDFDRDGRVDGVDLVTLARVFGARSGDAAFRFAYDLNDDLVIDGGDLAIVAANFGRSAS